MTTMIIISNNQSYKENFWNLHFKCFKMTKYWRLNKTSSGSGSRSRSFQSFQICSLIFFAYFYAKTWWTIQKSGNFDNFSFFNGSFLGFESKKFLVDILPLGSGSVDPQIFADPDPRSQNLEDPKHW